MKTYRQGDTVRLTVTVRDPSGVSYVNAVAYHESTGPESTPPATTDEQIYLMSSPPPQEPGPVQVELLAQVTAHVPGVYICGEVRAYDTLGQETVYPIDPPRQLHIVESGQEDREGPEIIDVAEEFS